MQSRPSTWRHVKWYSNHCAMAIYGCFSAFLSMTILTENFVKSPCDFNEENFNLFTGMLHFWRLWISSGEWILSESNLEKFHRHFLFQLYGISDKFAAIHLTSFYHYSIKITLKTFKITLIWHWSHRVRSLNDQRVSSQNAWKTAINTLHSRHSDFTAVSRDVTSTVTKPQNDDIVTSQCLMGIGGDDY